MTSCLQIRTNFEIIVKIDSISTLNQKQLCNKIQDQGIGVGVPRLVSSERGNYTRFKTIDIDNDCVNDAIGARDNSMEATEAGMLLLTALDLNLWVSVNSFIKE